MKLKNHLQFGNWVFYIGENDDIRIPAEGSVRTKRAAIQMVASMFDRLAAQGEPGYKQRAEEEAKAMGISYVDFLGRIIEHQICLRMSSSEKCLPSGIGDKIHSFIGEVEDTIERAPKPLKAVGQAIIRKSLQLVNGNKKATRARSCGSCGGTKSFTKSAWNFGRAGRMQKK
jgi:hypothetical protein